jgi:hypothetical protein
MAGGNLNRMNELAMAVSFGRTGASGEVTNAIAFLTSNEIPLAAAQTLRVSGAQTIAL